MRLAAALLGVILISVALPTSSASHILSAQSDAELLALAAAEGWAGTGAPGDPIVISGLTHRLLVQHVTLDLRIVDADIALGTSRNAAGISLLNVSDVVVENARVSGGGFGLFIQDAERAIVRGGEITGSRTTALTLSGGLNHPESELVVEGIRIAGAGKAMDLDHVGQGSTDVRYVTLEDNTNGIDATFFSSAGVLAIYDNRIVGTGGTAILVDRPHAFVGGNDIVDAGVGIEVRSGRDHTTIRGNNITDAGVALRVSARDAEVADHRIEDSGIGLQIIGGVGVTVRHNWFLGNNLGARVINAQDVLVYDNVFDNAGTNAEEITSDARWNADPVAGTNILGGSTIAGNAWNDNLCFDRAGDGVCDGSYLPLRPRPRAPTIGAGTPPMFDLAPLDFEG